MPSASQEVNAHLSMHHTRMPSRFPSVMPSLGLYLLFSLPESNSRGPWKLQLEPGLQCVPGL